MDLMAGGVMPKMVIEVPEEFTEVGKAMAEHLAVCSGRCPAWVAAKRSRRLSPGCAAINCRMKATS